MTAEERYEIEDLVVRPTSRLMMATTRDTPDGWVAGTGVGTYHQELGLHPSRDAATAAAIEVVEVRRQALMDEALEAGIAGALPAITVIHAERGESLSDALARTIRWSLWSVDSTGRPDEELGSWPFERGPWDRWSADLVELRSRPGQSNAYLRRVVIDPDGNVVDRDPRENQTPVGLAEIAERLAVAPQTARNWRTRGVMPEPDWEVSGAPAWNWSRVAAWALQTGRIS